MPDLLKLTHVSKRYGAGQNVLSDLCYEFKPGKATGLVGPNGSGKTTLLRLLSVTVYPTAGAIMYGELNIHKKPYNYLKHVGLVNDVTELPQYLTVVQLLEWILRAKHLWDEQSQANIGNLLDRLCFDERRDNLISTLSSGMSRKAQIALALIFKPSVLLMDEPFRGLDDASRDATLALLHEFQDGGGILVLASHLKGSLAPLCHNYLHLPV
jgi:ABC-type multidrug transport system ATPase subunit